MRLVNIVFAAIVAILVILFIVVAAWGKPPPPRWHRAHVTAYSTRDVPKLPGCYAPGKCGTACDTLLDDGRNTVAVRQGIGLDNPTDPRMPDCGAKITVCDPWSLVGPLPWRHWHCVRAIVSDRTESKFDLEFSLNLSLSVWRDAACWWCPRRAIWRRGW